MSINRIAYIDLNGRLCTINPDGSDQRVLTGQRRLFQFPSWSPTSEQIAAVGNNDNGGGLYVMSDKAQQTMLSPELYFSHNQFPFYQYWAPDGQSITFLTTHPNGFGLRIAYLTGKNYLLTVGQPLFWTWTNQPKMLFVHSGFNNAEARLSFIGTEGDGFGENVARPGYFQTPGVSNNGRFFAFAQVDSFNNRSLVIENSENNEKQLFDQKGMLALVWNPADQKLAYLATDSIDQRPYGPINVIDAKNNQEQTITQKNAIAFFWSPDGQKIAYLVLPSPANGVRSSSRSDYKPTDTMYTNGVVPFTLAMEEESPLLEFDLYIYDLKAQKEQFLYKCALPTTFMNQYLPFFDQYALSHRLWSPNSTHFMLPFIDGETAVLRVSSLDGHFTDIAEGLMPSWSIQ